METNNQTLWKKYFPKNFESQHYFLVIISGLLLFTLGYLGRVYLEEVEWLHFFSKSPTKTSVALDQNTNNFDIRNLKNRYAQEQDFKILSQDQIKLFENDFKILGPKLENSELTLLRSKLDALAVLVKTNISADKEAFYQKISKESEGLFAFIGQNNWPNLKKIVERFNLRSKVILQQKNYSQIIGLNSKDIDQMIELIQASQMKEENKNVLLGRLKPLKELWSNYSPLLDKYYSVVNSQAEYVAAVANVLKNEKFNAIKIIPSRVNESGTIKASSISPFFFPLIVLSFSVIALFGYFLFENYWKRSQLKIQEQHYLHVFDRAVLKNDQSELQEHNPNFRSTLMNISDYLQKRINFGNIFQEGIPFASILVEETKQVKWFNRLFIEQWEIDEETLSKERLSWDFLVNMTNIGSNDPVSESLSTKNHGIYQVQIKPFKSLESKSYQMFVCPVNYLDKSQCLLFFYPLMTLEETISIQTKSIVNPVRRTLEAMLDEQYGPKFESSSLREYEIGDIGQIHTLFAEVYKKFEFKWSQLVEEIHLADLSLQEKFVLIEKLEKSSKELKNLNKNKAKTLMASKDHLLSLCQWSSQIGEKSRDSLYSMKVVSQNYQQLFSLHRKVKEELSRVVQAAALLVPLKQSIKEHRDHLMHAKNYHSKFIKYAQQTMEKYVVKNAGVSLDPVVKDVNKIQDYFINDEKLFIQCDTFFSKLNLLIDDLKKLGLEQSDDIVAVTKVQEDGQRLEKEIDRLRNESSMEEEKFADVIKSLFVQSQNMNQCLASIEHLLMSHQQEENFLKGPNEEEKDSPPHLPYV